mmetsp:Transcript_56821/g.66418  ORF Transcript_56821/g.66418 Transcript_56821/m.66418 type:complete len:85 (-) Transcript_56821:69-323(-)
MYHNPLDQAKLFMKFLIERHQFSLVTPSVSSTVSIPSSWKDNSSATRTKSLFLLFPIESKNLPCLFRRLAAYSRYPMIQATNEK